MQYARVVRFENGRHLIKVRNGPLFTASEVIDRRQYLVIDGKLYLKEKGK